ncbi:hypothetical protein MICAI_1480011 [Microcystis sp. T1-4]|nr:hypothetical protein MICAI_1480011 [Microcystis sp. T1-4]
MAGVMISLALVKIWNGRDYDEIIRMCSHFYKFSECYTRNGKLFPPTNCPSV